MNIGEAHTRGVLVSIVCRVADSHADSHMHTQPTADETSTVLRVLAGAPPSFSRVHRAAMLTRCGMLAERSRQKKPICRDGSPIEDG